MKKMVSVLITLLLAGMVNKTSAQSAGDYRSKQTGAWNLATSWQTYNGSSWADASAAPSSSNGIITILSGHVITSSGVLTIDQVVINSGGTLKITGSTCTVANGTGTDINCIGTLSLTGGTLNGAGAVTFASGSTFDWAGGTVGGSGIITVNAGASFTMSGGTHYLSDTKTINNSGAWTWTGGTFYYYNGSAVVNNSGTFNISTDDDVTGFNSGAASFNNKPAGIINKIGSPSNDTYFNLIGTFTNEGTMNINSSRVRTHISFTNSGTINPAFGAHINFSSGIARFNTGTVLSGDGSVHFDGATDSIKAGSVSVKKMNLTSGTLTITPALAINSGTAFTVSGGTLNGAGAITFATGSTFDWAGGTVGGSGIITVNAGASFTMSGGTHYLSDTKTINNSGAWTWTGGTFYYYNGSAVVNNSGTFNISTDDDVIGFNSNAATFNNKSTGIINKTGSSSNDTYFSGIGVFTNAGTMNINSSKIRTLISSVNSGVVNIAFGSSINYSGGIARFNTGTQLNGDGSVHFDGAVDTINAGSVSVKTINLTSGTLTVMPALTMNSGTVFNLSGNTLNGTGSITFASGSTFNWTGGTLGGSGAVTVNSGAAFNMSGGNHYLADTRTINNSGVWTWTGGTFYYYNGSPVVNNSGTFHISTDAEVTNNFASTGTFNNKPAGIINKTGSSSNETYFSGFSLFTNAGTININSSRMRIYPNSVNTGTVNPAYGASINYTGGIARFNTGTVLKGSGRINFDGATDTISAGSVSVTRIHLSAGSLTIAPAITRASGTVFNLTGGTLNGTGAITFASGSTFNWTGGTLGGSGIMTVNSGAVFTMSGGNHNLADTRTINNSSVWTWTGGAFIFYNGSPVVNNSGTFHINTDNDITNNFATTGSFNNKPAGIINKTGMAAGDTYISNISSFNNEGAVNVNSGNLALNVNGTHAGTYKVASGSQLKGSIIMPYTGASFTNNGDVTLTGLTFGGSAVQSLSGTGTINTLTMNNASGLTLGGTQTIHTKLDLTSGKITIGNNNVLMGTSATLTGGSAGSYIVTNGTGSLQRRVPNNNTNVLFPVGYSTGYLPVIIQLTAASTADDFKVRLLPGIYGGYTAANSPTGGAITANTVKATWIVTENVAGGSSATLIFQWNAVDEAPGFNRTASRFGQYGSGAWTLDAAKAASGSNPYTLSRSGLTAFSPFGITNQFVTCTNSFAAQCAGGALTVPYTVVGTYNAGNVFTAQLSNASGNFAAPVNIGSVTSVSSGTISATIPVSTPSGTGYRIRVVSSNPSFTGPDNGSNITVSACGPKPGISDLTTGNSNADEEPVILPAGSFSIYPNPTNGQFIMQLQFKEAKTGYAHLRITNVLGQVFHVERVPVSGYGLKKRISFDPSVRPGIYLLTITVGNDIYKGKISYQKGL